MLFLAQFLGSEVVDSADQTVGVLSDLIATPGDQSYPPITALVVRGMDKKKLQKIISFSYVANLSKDEITLRTLAKNIEHREVLPADIFLYRDVLDKQIVDIEGTRVVRVNDLQFGMINGKPHVLGIDISTRGILRRIGLDRLKIFSFMKAKFIDWEKIQVIGTSLKLGTSQTELVRLHPADLANIVEDLNPSQTENIMKSLDTDTAAKVFEELEPQFRHYMMKLLDPKRAGVMLSRLPVDELVDYFKTLHKKEAKRLMLVLEEQKKKQVQKFLQYKDDSAGGLMTTEIVRADPGWTIAEAREHVRDISEKFRSINYLYVSNGNNELQGIVSIRSLIIAPPSEKLKKVMKKIKKNQMVHVESDVEDIARMMTKYNLSSVAVNDDQGRFIGVVTVDDVMRQLVPDA